MLRSDRQKAALFQLDDGALLRLAQIVPALFPVNRATWWAWCKKGHAPAPVKLGPSVTLRKLVGERLRMAHTLSEISQLEAARALGYKAASSLNEAEQGKRLLSLDKLMALASLYTVSLDYLFGATSEPYPDRESRLQQRLVQGICGRFQMLAQALASTNIDAVRSMGVDTAET